MNHVAYLEAKRTVDDRAIDRETLAAVVDGLPPNPRVLELGAGTVTMVERCYDRRLLDEGEWLAVDRCRAALQRGRDRLAERPESTVEGDRVELGSLTVRFLAEDAFASATRLAAAGESFDLLVGCAFFDLVDVDRLSTFEPLSDRLYAPITYDGVTAFSPSDPDDELVLSTYREHMETCRPGTPDGGARLCERLASIERVAPSPWVIAPPYTTDESRVVEHVLKTIEASLAELGVDATAWTNRRRGQLESGSLGYRAENVDVYGRL